MRFLCLLLVISFGMTSCHHYYYAPNTANAPLFSEKGETRINAVYAAGGNSSFNGGELQLAHAVSKNVGVMVNGLSAGRTEDVTEWYWGSGNGSHVESGQGSYLEIGAGYFNSFDDKKKWIGEIYGGAGLGTVSNDYGFNDHSKVNCSKFFLQPAIGYKTKYFEFAFVPKLSIIKWHVKDAKASNPENDYVNYDMEIMRNKPGFVAFEPAFLFRGGGNDFKVQLALSFSGNKSSKVAYSELMETLNASVGISIDLKPSKK